MNMRNKRIKFGIAASIAALALLIGATMAYFTDRASATATGTAGTVKISIDASGLANAMLSADGLNNFNPGDARVIDATIANEGNKSIDLRQTFVVSMAPAAGIDAFTALPTDASDPMGWAIYAATDVTGDATNGYVIKPGATPVATPSVATNNGETILTYVMPTDVVLNGTGANAETETGITDTSVSGTYVLAMMPSSDNSYQGASVSLTILAEAKQHRNTSGVTWGSLQNANTSYSVQVVPAFDEASDGTPVVTTP